MSGALRLRLHRDQLYIEAQAFDLHLASVRCVALLRDGGDCLIMPLASAEAGGFYIKQVNARGDRAIHAADFFRLNGVDDAADIILDAWPQSAIAGFVIRSLFADTQTKFAIRE